MSRTYKKMSRWLRRFAGPILRESELERDQILTAQRFDAGFPEGDSNYNSCTVGSDGSVYFALSTHQPAKHARLYCLDPSRDHPKLIADVGDVIRETTGDAEQGFLGQGKIHVDFFEFDGSFHTATLQSLKPGIRPYSGGRFLALDIPSRRLKVVGEAPAEEGIISMAADYQRARLYGLTYPKGLLLSCDLASGATTTIGGFFGKGEQGWFRKRGSSPICRSLALDPRNGTVYWSDSLGRIRAYGFESDSVKWLDDCRLSGDGFYGSPIWRQTLWHPVEKVFYGVQFRHSVLFRFDPDLKKIDFVDHIPAVQYRNKRSRNEPRATLAFRLAPDGETIYYLTIGPPLLTRENRWVRRTVHFISYHVPTRQYRDFGVVRLCDGRYPVYCQSMAVHDRMVYAVCWIEIPSGLNEIGSSTEAIRKARAVSAPIESDDFIEEANLICFPLPDENASN